MLVAKNILPETARILQCRYLRSRLGNALSEPRAWDKSWGAQKYSPKARQRWARCWLPKISCQKQQESYNVGTYGRGSVARRSCRVPRGSSVLPLNKHKNMRWEKRACECSSYVPRMRGLANLWAVAVRPNRGGHWHAHYTYIGSFPGSLLRRGACAGPTCPRGCNGGGAQGRYATQPHQRRHLGDSGEPADAGHQLGTNPKWPHWPGTLAAHRRRH